MNYEENINGIKEGICWWIYGYMDIWMNNLKIEKMGKNGKMEIKKTSKQKIFR